ncbi:pyruvate formate lyase-activating protein [Aggregatibacter aphrophilus NJ8700]|uniref:Pyruvate formate lyase-activating protein n=1 Tax=Aggregatibacter aphrophilus TaxID=732 RepID=A0ABX9VUD6_AGGAP|nr:pyruvate formate lyase-activating enzyme 1 [Aggregatibacter aphrophilus NJ8700]AKU62406.1 pyruvate formate lyase-activating protein [Aggregatibacter aphrophilus]EHB89536.1 hypothetical protein HMPREF9335_01687 [Aggregatibacter aphrophilus F0387]AKS65271.1 pyruvate formate lyase-activating protein [Aggregatibacter aphrophilus NJ8700]PNL92838.1 pyruvate formate lyase-activating protein [Aggregatibacter aphrophilus]
MRDFYLLSQLIRNAQYFHRTFYIGKVRSFLAVFFNLHID